MGRRHRSGGVIVTTSFVPDRFDAVTVWPFILVRPGKESDTGLIEHELVHYREQRWTTPVWWARYLLSPAFRLAAEVRAYRRQIEVGGISLGTAAHYLVSKYRLSISFTEALGRLAGRIE